MKIGLIGYGKMAKSLLKLASSKNLEIAPPFSPSQRNPLSLEKLEPLDVLIDFSHPDAVFENVAWACRAKKPIVQGTTGWKGDEERIKASIKEANIGLIAAPNLSIAVGYYLKLIKQASKLLKGFSPGLIETHHKDKVDAPSGLALKIQELFDEPLPTSSLRLGDKLPRHELTFEGPFEEISLTHQCKDRLTYAEGAILAAEWIKEKKGFYTMEDLIDDIT